MRVFFSFQLINARKQAIYVPRLGTFRVGKVKVNGSSRSLSFPQPTFEFADIFSSIPTTVPKFIPAGTT